MQKNLLKTGTQESWSRKDEQLIWHPFSPLIGEGPVMIERGEGPYLYTSDGRRIIDAISSWWVNIHGHGRKEIAEAIAAQAMKLEQVIFAGFTHEPAIRLADGLTKILPKAHSKIFFSDNGSTAVEVGLKMALQFWHNIGKRRHRIIAIEGAYHGDTFGAMAVGDRGAFSKPFHPYLFEVDFIPYPEGHNDDEVIDTFKKLAATGEVAAFIFEPLLQGSAGMRAYPPDLMDVMLQVCEENDIITIADEVMTGFGRTGHIFASDYLQHDPDIICMSKGITGGFLPLGVTSCSGHIEDAFRTEDKSKTFYHGHSYTANPLACAAAVASLDILLSDECTRDRLRIYHQHELFAERMRDHSKVSKVRHLGTVVAFEVNTNEETGYMNNVRYTLYKEFLRRDVLLRPLGNVVYILPPYVISNQDLDKVYNAVEEVLDII
jgi:adenosylmethionine-8-amino-7-oxononanoate aminotransferase